MTTSKLKSGSSGLDQEGIFLIGFRPDSGDTFRKKNLPKRRALQKPMIIFFLSHLTVIVFIYNYFYKEVHVKDPNDKSKYPILEKLIVLTWVNSVLFGVVMTSWSVMMEIEESDGSPFYISIGTTIFIWFIAFSIRVVGESNQNILKREAELEAEKVGTEYEFNLDKLKEGVAKSEELAAKEALKPTVTKEPSDI
jgi:hypothetical protein